MKIPVPPPKKTRVEMLPLIDIVFLLLVFFIYAMLSMTVHRGLPVQLPGSTQAELERQWTLAVSVMGDGTVYLNKHAVPLAELGARLAEESAGKPDTGVLVFAERELAYQRLFGVLDQIRSAGLTQVSLQAQLEP